jgi:anti-sigma regulatory factor (Ser/Thr protein kinase)
MRLRKDSGMTDGVKIVFSAEMDSIKAAVDELVSFIKATPAQLDMFSFRLVLFESITNAVRHGSKLRADMDVTVTLSLRENHLEITVEDGGEGFDWRKVSHHPDLSRMTASGRGIFLMKKYGYHPSYNESGNILTLKKSLGHNPHA